MFGAVWWKHKEALQVESMVLTVLGHLAMVGLVTVEEDLGSDGSRALLVSDVDDERGTAG